MNIHFIYLNIATYSSHIPVALLTSAEYMFHRQIKHFFDIMITYLPQPQNVNSLRQPKYCVESSPSISFLKASSIPESLLLMTSPDETQGAGRPLGVDLKSSRSHGNMEAGVDASDWRV